MAAQSGMATFRGRSGQGYSKNIYFDDTAGNLVRWDGGAGAGATSPDNWVCPEQVRLIDVVLAAATGQTKTQINVNDKGTGDILLNALYLASIVSRPIPGRTFPGGAKITMTQLA